jgi:hypothetical protein
MPGATPDRRAITAALALTLAAAPFLLDPGAYLPRAVLTGFAISIAMKVRLVWVGRDADPGMLATLPRFVAWLAIPPATAWPRDPARARQIRRGAGPRLGRALLRLPVLLAVGWAKTWWLISPAAEGLTAPGLAATLALVLALALRAVVEMLQFYLLLTALSDGLIGLGNLAGIATEEPFVHPARARGPHEFWSLRWNRVVHRFARCEVFLPLVRRRGPVVAVLASFAASGVMHEYLVLAAVGLSAYRPGFMLLFFALQALAVLAERALVDRRGRRRWPPLLHLGWLALTTPLFFLPLRPQITAFDSVCAWIVDRAVSLLS